MGRYTNIKSKLIREKIKKANWKNEDERQKIDDLIFIEDIILGKERMGWMGSFKWNALEKTKEFKEIYQELKPKEFAKIKKQEAKETAKEKREEAKWKGEGKLEEERDKKDWIRAGGNL